MKLLQELLESINDELNHEIENITVKFAHDIATALKKVDRIKDVRISQVDPKHTDKNVVTFNIKADPIKKLQVSGQIVNLIGDHEGAEHLKPYVEGGVHLQLNHKPDDLYKQVLEVLTTMLSEKYNRSDKVFDRPWFNEDHNVLTTSHVKLGSMLSKFYKKIDAKRAEPSRNTDLDADLE